jgi:hypothetical protein
MAGYDAQPFGDATEFSVTPERAPIPWVILVIPGVLIVAMLLISVVAAFVLAAFCAAVIYFTTRSKKFTQYRAPSRFRVSRAAIDIGGKTIPKESIHRIIVRNHVLPEYSNVAVVVNPGPTNVGQANAAVGTMWAINQLGPVSYRVDAEARGVPTTLAGGLTEPTAAALASDISKCLQLA